MSIEKLTAETINRLLKDATQSDRKWRSEINQCFKDFTAVKVIDNANFRNSELNYSNFKGISFHSVRFEDSKLHYCNFSDCSFDSCDFSDVRAIFANFQNAKFTNCFLDAPLLFSNFEAATFTHCSLGNSNLLMTNFTNARFSDSEALEVRFLDHFCL